MALAQTDSEPSSPHRGGGSGFDTAYGVRVQLSTGHAIPVALVTTSDLKVDHAGSSTVWAFSKARPPSQARDLSSSALVLRHFSFHRAHSVGGRCAAVHCANLVPSG
jgi:hypothetical protein